MSRYTAAKVCKVAHAEVGYLEKKSDYRLDEKTANAGSNNYTKYGKKMHQLYPAVMDFPAAWCDCFVDWCHYKASGDNETDAKAALCGNFDDYTVTSADYYKRAGRWGTTPKLGAQVFFTNASGGICHTGIVYGYGPTAIKTIEGNTSNASGVVANGGGVARKEYALHYHRIAGYGYPKYSKEPLAPGKYKCNTSRYAHADSSNASARNAKVKRGEWFDVTAVRINEYGRAWGYAPEHGGWVYLGGTSRK